MIIFIKNQKISCFTDILFKLHLFFFKKIVFWIRLRNFVPQNLLKTCQKLSKVNEKMNNFKFFAFTIWAKEENWEEMTIINLIYSKKSQQKLILLIESRRVARGVNFVTNHKSQPPWEKITSPQKNFSIQKMLKILPPLEKFLATPLIESLKNVSHWSWIIIFVIKNWEFHIHTE